MPTNAWNYAADRRYIDRITKSTNIDCVIQGRDGIQKFFYKTPQLGIVTYSPGVYFVNIFKKSGDSNSYYQNLASPFAKVGASQHPRFSLYPMSLYGVKDRSAALGSSAQAGIAVTTNSLNPVFGSALTASPDSLQAKLDYQKFNEIASRPYTGTADFAERTASRLRALGYTQLEISAYLKATNDAERRIVATIAEQRVAAALREAYGNEAEIGSGGGGGGSGGAGARSNPMIANQTPVSSPELETRLVVRMPAGYLPPGNLSGITKPALHQTFVTPKGKVKTYTYQFDYIPSEIRYSGLGSEWVEIPRAENFPFVDWNRYQLMKVSMSWIIAYDRVEPGGAKVHDGMYKSVDSAIRSLRNMAQRKHPVTIVNMDDLLSIQLKRAEQTGAPRGMQFVITDLNITAARRTTDPITGKSTSPSKIAVAQVEMTLQEIPIEGVQILTMPKMSIPFTPPGRPGGSIPAITEPGGLNLSPQPDYSAAARNRAANVSTTGTP